MVPRRRAPSREERDVTTQLALQAGLRLQEMEQQLAALLEQLTAAETELLTARMQLETFQRLRDVRLASLYARLDELDACIAEALAIRSGRKDDAEQAARARRRAEQSQHFAASAAEDPTPDEVPPAPTLPSDEARRLFRTLARQCHPDLVAGACAEDRARHEAFMARVNAAYAANDVELLRSLAAEWQLGRSGSSQEQVYDRELLLLKASTATQRRLDKVRRKIKELKTSPLGLLFFNGDAEPALQQIQAYLVQRIREREDICDRIQGTM
jgi:hypothetical protein